MKENPLQTKESEDGVEANLIGLPSLTEPFEYFTNLYQSASLQNSSISCNLLGSVFFEFQIPNTKKERSQEFNPSLSEILHSLPNWGNRCQKISSISSSLQYSIVHFNRMVKFGNCS